MAQALDKKRCGPGVSPPPAAAPTHPSFRDIQLKIQSRKFSRKFSRAGEDFVGVAESFIFLRISAHLVKGVTINRERQRRYRR